MSSVLTPAQRPIEGLPSAPAADLPASIEELRAAALGRLSANLAHELRNTLTGVRCCLELLPPTTLEQPLGGLLAELSNSVERMAELSGLWLQVSRGSGATCHLNREVVRLLALLEGCGLARRVHLVRELDPAVEVVSGDPVALEAALLGGIGRMLARAPETIAIRTEARGDAVRVILAARGLGPSLSREAPAPWRLAGEEGDGESSCWLLALAAAYSPAGAPPSR